MSVQLLYFSRYSSAGFAVVICLCLVCGCFSPYAIAALNNSSDQKQYDKQLQEFSISVVDNDNPLWETLELEPIVGLLHSLPKELHPVNLMSASQLPLKLRKVNGGNDAHSLFYEKSDVLKIFFNTGERDKSPARQLLHFLLHKYDSKTNLSDNKRWLAISGWNNRIVFPAANNQDERAYATPEGKRNPREDFVSTAEQFFMPPISTAEDSIKCRIPRKYEFIKSHFSSYHSALDREYVRCLRIDEGLLDDIEFYSPSNGEKVNIGPINMQTVTGFELLYATPGTGDASEIAGHLLLRIKLDNNPEADKLGIQNPHDLVISFLANTQENMSRAEESEPEIQASCKSNWFNLVDDGQQGFDALQSIFQSLKGLTGGFLTIMDRQTLGHAIKHYTIEEDRNLLRYELLLSEQQKYDLLQHLYRAKKNYNAKYFFFNQNCASVLVKVVGQGIGVEEIADFNPMVSPPNSLVALFIRHGLAKPVYPSFHSYRKKGFLAQEHIKRRYQAIKSKQSHLSWPDIDGLYTKKEARRLSATKSLRAFYPQAPQYFQEFYYLASLIQEAEMVYDRKELLCVDYTSPITGEARSFQQQLLAAKGEEISQQPLNIDEELTESYINTESDSFSGGVPYTKLLSYKTGLGYYHTEQIEVPVLQLEATAVAQDMGSTSNVAMQRGGFVRLADFSISVAMDEEKDYKIQQWRATFLKIRKFKERLNHVPSYFSPQGSMGLGLTLVDFVREKPYELKHGTLLGGELLFNLISSREHEDFAFVSFGADVHSHTEGEDGHRGLMLPVHGELLLGFGEQRRWQWRSKMDYKFSLDNDLDDEVDVNTELSYRLGNLNGSLVFVKLASHYYQTLKQDDPDAAWLNWVGLEVNHW